MSIVAVEPEVSVPAPPARAIRGGPGLEVRRAGLDPGRELSTPRGHARQRVIPAGGPPDDVRVAGDVFGDRNLAVVEVADPLLAEHDRVAGTVGDVASSDRDAADGVAAVRPPRIHGPDPGQGRARRGEIIVAGPGQA